MKSRNSLSTTSFTKSPTTSSELLQENTTWADGGETDRNGTSPAQHDRDNGYDLRVLLCAVVGMVCLVLALVLGLAWWRRNKLRLRATFSVMYRRYFRSSISDVINWNGTFRRTAAAGCADREAAADGDSPARVYTEERFRQAETTRHPRSLDFSNLTISQFLENHGQRTCSSSSFTEVPITEKYIPYGTNALPQHACQSFRSSTAQRSPTYGGYVSLYDVSLTQVSQAGQHPTCSSHGHCISAFSRSDTNATSRPESDSLYYSEVNYRANVNTLFGLDSQSPDNDNTYNKGDVYKNFSDLTKRESEDTSRDRNSMSCTYYNQNHAPRNLSSSNFHKHGSVYSNFKDAQRSSGDVTDTGVSKGIQMHSLLHKAIPNDNAVLDSKAVFLGIYANSRTLHLDITGSNHSTDTDA